MSFKRLVAAAVLVLASVGTVAGMANVGDMSGNEGIWARSASSYNSTNSSVA